MSDYDNETADHASSHSGTSRWKKIQAIATPTVTLEERHFILQAIEKSGAMITAKMIYDLYCLENTRSMLTNRPRVEVEQWVKDPRFVSQIQPYGIQEITRLVIQLSVNSENNSS